MEISFDKEIAVAKIQLAEWAPPLVEHLGRYFGAREGMLRLDYAHLAVEGTHALSDWWHNERERFEFNLRVAAHEGPIAVTLVLLGRGNSGIQGSSSILDQHAYLSEHRESSSPQHKYQTLHGGREPPWYISIQTPSASEARGSFG